MTWCDVSYVTVHMKLYYNDLRPSKDRLLFFKYYYLGGFFVIMFQIKKPTFNVVKQINK